MGISLWPKAPEAVSTDVLLSVLSAAFRLGGEVGGRARPRWEQSVSQGLPRSTVQHTQLHLERGCVLHWPAVCFARGLGVIAVSMSRPQRWGWVVHVLTGGEIPLSSWCSVSSQGGIWTLSVLASPSGFGRGPEAAGRGAG